MNLLQLSLAVPGAQASILYGLFTLLARETSIRMSSIKMNGYFQCFTGKVKDLL
jgi:hypothetical protein